MATDGMESEATDVVDMWTDAQLRDPLAVVQEPTAPLNDTGRWRMRIDRDWDRIRRQRHTAADPAPLSLSEGALAESVRRVAEGRGFEIVERWDEIERASHVWLERR